MLLFFSKNRWNRDFPLKIFEIFSARRKAPRQFLLRFLKGNFKKNWRKNRTNFYFFWVFHVFRRLRRRNRLTLSGRGVVYGILSFERLYLRRQNRFFQSVFAPGRLISQLRWYNTNLVSSTLFCTTFFSLCWDESGKTHIFRRNLHLQTQKNISNG